MTGTLYPHADVERLEIELKYTLQLLSDARTERDEARRSLADSTRERDEAVAKMALDVRKAHRGLVEYAERSRAFVSHALDYLQLMEKLAGDPAKAVELRQYVVEAASALRAKAPTSEPLGVFTDQQRIDFLQAQLAHGWGDGFAVQLLDSGGVYVRPWRKEMMQMKGFTDIAWYPTARAAIDAAMGAQVPSQGGHRG